MIELPIIQPQHKKQLQSVLIKPSGADCNLDCIYCFYLEKAEMYPEQSKHRMSVEVMEEMVKQVMQSGGNQLSFGWQGGEPTLLGLEFYEKAVEFQKKYGRDGQSVGNGFQTNGILISDEWCQFFNRYSFLIGLSLDGPAHIHDHYRITKGGGASWSRVHDTAKRLLDRGVATNALVVVNDYSSQHPEEIYEFHKDLGFEFMQFIPCVERDPRDPSKAAAFSVSDEQYGEFLCRIFDCWKKDFNGDLPTTSVRYFDSVFHLYVDMQPPDCTLLEECGCYVVVEHNGDIYSCDFFVEDDWRLGNLMEGSIVEMLNSDHQGQFGCMKSDLPPECPECEWLRYCNGGCTKDRIRDPKDNGSNHFCESFKMFFNHANDDMQRLADQWIIDRKQEEEDYHKHQQEEIRRMAQAQNIGRNDPCPCGSGKKFKKCCGQLASV